MPKISVALVTVDPADRPVVVVNSPVSLSRLLANILPRQSSNADRTTPTNLITNKRTHGLVVPPPAPIRPHYIFNPEQCANGCKKKEN